LRYRVRLTNRFKRSFRKLARNVQERIEEAVGIIAERPRSGHYIMTMNLWSYRVGDYRILYHIDDERGEVILLLVRHRRGVYR